MSYRLISNQGTVFPIVLATVKKSHRWSRMISPGFTEEKTRVIPVDLNDQKLDNLLYLVNLTDENLRMKLEDKSEEEINNLQTIIDKENLFLTGPILSLIPKYKTIVGGQEWNFFINNLNPNIEMDNNLLIRLFISGNRKVRNLSPFIQLAHKFSTMNFFSTPLFSLNGARNFSSLKSLNISRTQINDDELENLSSLTQLTRLELNGNEIENLDPIKTLTNLTKLGLACTFVRDLRPLLNMSQLITLDLYQTNVVGLTEIMHLPITDLDRRITTIDLRLAKNIFPEAEVV